MRGRARGLLLFAVACLSVPAIFLATPVAGPISANETAATGVSQVSAAPDTTDALASDLQQLTEYIREIDYEDYLEAYRGSPRPAFCIVVPAEAYSATDMDVSIEYGLGGYAGAAVITHEVGFIEWEIPVQQAGLYNIAVLYYPVPGRGVAIERELWINGERPFSGARYLRFRRVWGDAAPPRRDSMGNEIRSPQIEKPMWMEVPLTDHTGRYGEPYLFYLNEGVNKIRFISRAEPMAIAHIRVYQAESPPPYSEVAKMYEANGYKPTENILIKIQGQDALYRSDPTLFAITDHGDPTVEPYHPAELRLNAIGGHRWSSPGQWISWTFEVPENGLYKIAIKAKQDQRVGAFSSRRVLIDGKVPFAEVDSFRFEYSSRYKMHVLGDKDTGEPYLFYLTKGIHELRLEVVLGDIRGIIETLEDCLYELNTIYRRIIMITSANPDRYRTYELHRKIPEVIDRIRAQAEIFDNLVTEYSRITGMEGGHSEILSRHARLLHKMADDPDSIPAVLSEYRDNLGAIGTWVYETSEQPLQIDQIFVASLNEALPRATPTFWQVLAHEIRSVIASFSREYDLIGDMADTAELTKGKEPLVVWIGAGRDQAQILKQMIDDTFVVETGIPVTLQLVPQISQLYIRAATAGTGPDVAVGLAVPDVVNFGIRGGLVNLAEFEDFEEVAKRFMKCAFVPFSFRDHVWALPQMQSFPLMFYRKDILAELGLEVPDTWDDLYRMLPVLQRNNMLVGIGPGIYQTWLYQRGELVYKPDGVETNLDSEVAVQTFRELTELFSLYGLLLTYNAENRFRLGEMPIVIEDWGLYNRLQVFAPELRGEWGFTLVPGTLQEDGTINRTVASSPSGSSLTQAGMGGPAVAISSQSNQKKEAWEFLKWLTRTDTQVRLGLELESLMGAAARYPTANLEAFEQLPWTVEERQIIREQWNWIEGTLEVPGSYYFSRMFNWAFRAVVLNYEPVRETLMEYNTQINYELQLKRREFGLETRLEDVPQEYIDLFWSRFTHIKRK